MNVVVNALSARTGGGRTYLRNLLAVQPPDGMQVQVLALPGTVPRPSSGVELLELRSHLGNPLVRAVWERRRLPRLLRDLDADVLFCPGGLVGTRPPAGCRTVAMCRNMLPFDSVQRARYPMGYTRVRTTILEPLLLQSMRRADLVIFVSRHALEMVGRRVGGGPEKTAVIPHGVSEEFRAGTPRARPAWLPDGDYLLYVSNLEPYKRQVEVVRAFARLRRRRQGTEALVLVGPASSKSYAASLRSEVARLGLTAEVMIANEVDHEELPAVYQHARVGIFASECENCPNVLLEAMAAGRPLVVSNRPPMPEFAGQSVSYFDPTDPDELADRLVELLDDPERQEVLGRAAALHAQAYDWHSTAERTWRALFAASAAT